MGFPGICSALITNYGIECRITHSGQVFINVCALVWTTIYTQHTHVLYVIMSRADLNHHLEFVCKFQLTEIIVAY